MALGASVYKVNLDVSDTDRHYYVEHKLTLARHPSETEARMMVRLLAFALHAHEDLAFGRGISTVDEPDLWQCDPAGVIQQWIDVGQPTFERMKKARSRAAQVFLYTFGRGRDVWWQTQREALQSLPALTVIHLDDNEVTALATLADKNMNLSVCMTDGQVYISAADQTITLTPEKVN